MDSDAIVVERIGRLVQASGISGFEKEVGTIIKDMIGSRVDQVEEDAVGNIIMTIKGTDPGNGRVIFAAHQDEVGFLVDVVEKGGFLRLVAIGGWNPVTLPSSPVTIITRDGKRHHGVIGQLSPHFQPKGAPPSVPSLDDLFVDVGASSDKDVEEIFGIRRGDIVVPEASFTWVRETGVMMGKAMDDRIGVAALIELAYALTQDGKRPVSTVILAFTVQEEVGTRGAGVVANYLDGDAAIIVEGAPADDMPGGPAIAQTRRGKGAHVRIFDPTHIGHRGVLDLLRGIAHAQGIQVQEAVRKGGGTDAVKLSVAQRGIPAVVTGVPVRYAHSHESTASLFDFNELVRLLSAFCNVSLKDI
ncbi:Glutamyl aminopeptidase [Parasphaerochaeta coccoides DSM 17374]|uniref:Glutamyl aminopeptidase n=2 Tax=Parasphaerochaeta TaxID=3062336 RepID=F4GLW3_PARC1|nr:Glutamyl aminopeptidase [Parasphaerochaeta coccoides DSM 17374]